MHDEPKPPTLRGPVAQRLRQGRRPGPSAAAPLALTGRPIPQGLVRAEERAAVMTALLILELACEGGGTRHGLALVHQLLRDLARGFDERELMQLEVEAYEVLRWLDHTLRDELPLEPGSPPYVNADSTHLEVIRWALHHGQDLRFDYYHPGRGEVTRRHVTPLRLDAEAYLVAFCHLRADERVFRLSRVGELRPASGWPTTRHGLSRPPQDDAPTPGVDPAQPASAPHTPPHTPPHTSPHARARRLTPPGQMSLPKPPEEP